MTYNQRTKILALLSDFSHQTYPADRVEVVVLVETGTDGTLDALNGLEPMPYQLTVLTRRHSRPYLNALRWNECIAAASPHSTVLIQVDDVRVRTDFIERHAAWHSQEGQILVTGAKFEADAETWSLATCRRAHLASEAGGARESVPWTAAWAASMSYPRALVDALSCAPHERPFDERMTGWGYHEVEFACRAVAAGAQVVYDPGVGVFHQNHTPSNDRGRGIDHRQQQDLGAQRNARYVSDKHGLSELPRW